MRVWGVYRYTADKARITGERSVAERFYRAALMEAESLKSREKIEESRKDLLRIQEERRQTLNATSVSYTSGPSEIRLVWNSHLEYSQRVYQAKTTRNWQALVNVLLERERRERNALTVSQVGSMLMRMADYPKAYEFMVQSIELAKDEFGPESSQLAAALDRAAEAKYALGLPSEAAEFEERAALIADRAAETLLRMTIRLHLAQIANSIGQPDRALELLSSAMEGGHSVRSDTIDWYRSELEGQAYLLKSRLEDAEKSFSKAKNLALKTFGPESAELERSMKSHAECMIRLKRLDVAREEFIQASYIKYDRDKKPRRDSFDHDLGRLGHFYRGAGKFDIAEPLYSWALSGREKTDGTQNESLVPLLYALSFTCQQTGDLDCARKYLKRARTICSGSLDGVAMRHRYEVDVYRFSVK